MPCTLRTVFAESPPNRPEASTAVLQQIRVHFAFSIAPSPSPIPTAPIRGRDICTRVGCAIETVQRHWNAWLDGASEERRTKLERHQTEIMVRLDHIAADARRGAIAAEDESAVVVRFLTVERRALVDMARVGGLFAPQTVTVGGGLQFPTEEEARRTLAKLDKLPPMAV